MTVDYIVGDTRDVTATIPDGSVSLVACSPPFIALRSYLPADHPDKDKEIGSEPDPATFLDTLLGLTAEWGRVLAPWGSIAIELGDTFSGSGGENNPYASGYSGGSTYNTQKPPGAVGTRGGEWPMAKSLSLVPQLYAASLAYGRNILTGQPSPAGQWRVRNMIVWHRPNPAVGALGDKYRPCTSYITVATRDSKRWFDLTAVRTPPTSGTPGAVLAASRGVMGFRGVHDGGTERMQDTPQLVSHAAGAPPLDCWFDEWDGSHDTWTQTTQPSRIKAEFVERVPCGPDDGGERTTSPDCPVHGDHAALAPTESDDEHAAASSHHIGRTGTHPAQSQQPAEPYGESTSSRSGPQAANARSTSSNRTDPAPSTSQPDTPSARTADDTAHTSTSPELCESRRGTCESSTCEACPPADAPETAPHTDDSSYPESACSCTFHIEKHSIHSHYAMWPAKLAERLILSMCPAEVCTFCREPRRRMVTTAPQAELRSALSVHIRTQREAKGLTVKELAAHFPSTSGNLTGCVWNWENNANVPTSDQWPTLKALIDLDDKFDAVINGERNWTELAAEYVGGQRGFTSDNGTGRGGHHGIPRATLRLPDLGWTDCGCGVPFTPGTVLDPFAGTFTTGLVAEYHGRNAIGIDLDPRNADLVPLRREEVRRNLNPTHVRTDPAQLELFGAA